MRSAYLDCFAGLSGDMFLGALVGAGVDAEVLHQAIAALNLNASLQIRTVDRSGISSVKVDVLEGAALAEAKDAGSSRHAHPEEQNQPEPRTPQLQTQHQHKTGHAHDHSHTLATTDSETGSHSHPHGRSLSTIRSLIQNSGLTAPVIRTAVHAFELLGASEAAIHNVPVEEIHFHEVGAVDAIVDIVASAAGIHALAPENLPLTWVASPVNVGGGMVECAHGRFPVPAPATADLLRGIPTYSANVQMELVTPTGAALLRTLVEEKGLTFGPQPAMRVEKIGYGAGTRNPPNFPNVFRLSIGESSEDLSKTNARVPHPSQSHRDGWDVQTSPVPGDQHNHHSETVVVLETALDDLSPQLLAHVAELALQQGALDVMLTPVIMKKGRPGSLLTVLCNPTEQATLEHLILTETSTLGIRIREDRRSCLHRTFQSVDTPYGQIKIKIGMMKDETLNAAPEFEDCRTASINQGVAVKTVQQAAIAAYVSRSQASGVNHD